MDAATYWRLRYLQADAEKAAMAAAGLEARFRDALRSAGVDPAMEHRWDDNTTSLVPVRPEPSK